MKDALALALVHFIWQGALLAAAGWVLIRVSKTPSIRYVIGIATMGAMLSAPALTFVAVTYPGLLVDDTRSPSQIFQPQGAGGRSVVPASGGWLGGGSSSGGAVADAGGHRLAAPGRTGGGPLEGAPGGARL